MVQKCKLCSRENSIGERILFLRGYKKDWLLHTHCLFYLFIYLFTDILKDTITPYNVSNLHTCLFTNGHISQTSAWLVKAIDLLRNYGWITVSFFLSLSLLVLAGDRPKTANASKQLCSLNVVVWSQLTFNHKWDSMFKKCSWIQCLQCIKTANKREHVIDLRN